MVDAERDSGLDALRRFYARSVVAESHSSDAALIGAFAAVPRERFVGPGPWLVCTPMGYVETPGDDAGLLYRDVLIGLLPERHINNGQPSLHAKCLAALRLHRGATVLHVGAGTGYYSAVIAELVGPRGTVHAYEIEPTLAAKAADALAPWPNVQVHARSACAGALPRADVIYVNAGATHPPAAWLDALAPGGRLLLPLTAEAGDGAMLLVTRRGADRFGARFLERVMFIECSGARDEAASHALASAFATRRLDEVRSLRRHAAPDASAWLVGDGWWLSTAPP